MQHHEIITVCKFGKLKIKIFHPMHVVKILSYYSNIITYLYHVISNRNKFMFSLCVVNFEGKRNPTLHTHTTLALPHLALIFPSTTYLIFFMWYKPSMAV
jgi:hypothetical protein